MDGNVDSIARFFKSYFKENLTQIQENKVKSGLKVFSKINGWMVIKWPYSYDSYCRLSKKISKEFQTIVSVVMVHDGGFWEHTFFKKGSLLDDFSSAPDYFGEISPETLPFIDPGDPELIATELKINVEKIKPYFIRNRDLERRSEIAFPEDIYSIRDGLVFIDFWDKIGVTLPEDKDVPAYAFELDSKYIRKDAQKYFNQSKYYGSGS